MHGGTQNQFSEVAPTELIDQTNDQFVEYELKLNNQDQYNSGAEESEDIEEAIVTGSQQSGFGEANKQLQENLRLKMQAKKEERQKIISQQPGADSAEGNHSFGASGMKNTGMKFGTQIVNYQPNFVEQSESDDSNDNQDRAD